MNKRTVLTLINVLVIVMISFGISGCQLPDSIDITGTISSVDNNLDDSEPTLDPELTPDLQPTTETEEAKPVLSGKDSISLDGEVVLNIDDDEIIDYFNNEVFLCSDSAKEKSEERKMFCENKETFKNMTRFIGIVESPDKTAIGFDVITSALQPDSIAGIFYPNRTTDRVHFVSRFYIGNTFINFSPSGKYFVYIDDCWEGWCGLRIRETETLEKVSNVGDSEFVDMREANYSFVKWISDNEVEYKLGSELKRETF